MRLRPGQHLRRQSDIRDVRQKGTRLDCRAFTIWHMAGNVETPERRACFVASTQAVGKAILRNRAKRRLREVFRRHQQLLPKSCDLLMVARAQVNTWDMVQLERVFSEACARMVAAPAAS
ncbi:MAG TPA: ribonuclease P protein component [Opitutaceae bacterium]|jgi:ribonuclease P protein component|nr:ribonuclease P protein component [Opitutaceae bacterium]